MISIGLDSGTSAIKGVCFSPEKGVIKKISRPVELLHPAENRTELDAEKYFHYYFFII